MDKSKIGVILRLRPIEMKWRIDIRKRRGRKAINIGLTILEMNYCSW